LPWKVTSDPREMSLLLPSAPLTVESHLEQSAHLMEALKISMSCWMIAEEGVTPRKMTVATYHGVPTVTGGGPFEIAVAQRQLEAYLDLCADMGVTRIECGEVSPVFASRRRAS
jgi:phosphosulfolactate synthase